MGSSAHGTVAIIGAGAAGLVSAKSMLEVGLAPTVFDKADHIAGLWHPELGRCWDTLRTNLTKYTCSFSDKPWDSNLPVHPTREQVYSYLTSYATPFLADVHLRLNTEVKTVDLTEDQKWHVVWRGSAGDAGSACSQVFDHLVVAAGVHGDPKVPDLPGSDVFRGQLLHSSQYKTAAPFRGKRVVTVGANHSATDIAADVARVASQVVQVSPAPLWVLPRHIPVDPSAAVSPFMPLDFVFFSRTEPGPKHEDAFLPPEKGAFINESCRKICGWPEGLVPDALINDGKNPPTISISDPYTGLLACHKIALHAGHVVGLTEKSILLSDDSAIDDVDVVIWGTGYRVPLSFLSGPVQEALAFDPDDTVKPTIAHRTTFHPDLPNFAAVGIIRGALFGVMEAQARWAAAVFAGRVDAPTAGAQLEGIKVDKQVRDLHPRPQLPHSDYVGLMDDLYGFIGVQADEQTLGPGTFLFPSQFRPGTEFASQASGDAEKTKAAMSAGRGVAMRVFYSLTGQWKFTRNVDTRNGESGSLAGSKGLAEFDASQSPLLYRHSERCDCLARGLAQAFAEHAEYRLNEVEGTIEFMLMPTENGEDGQSFVIYFLDPKPDDKCWKARGHTGAGGNGAWHELAYEFYFSGSFMSAFNIIHTYHDPADAPPQYRSSTSYKRPACP